MPQHDAGTELPEVRVRGDAGRDGRDAHHVLPPVLRDPGAAPLRRRCGHHGME